MHYGHHRSGFAAALLACLALTGARPCDGAIPLAGSERILFLGTRMIGDRGGLDEYVKRCLAAAPSPVTVTTRRIVTTGPVPGGAHPSGGLAELWNAGTGAGTARAEIASGNWDIVVLQPSNELIVEDESGYATIRSFDQAIKAAGALTVLFVPWSEGVWWDFREPTMACMQMGGRIAAEIGALVLPVGHHWLWLMDAPPSGLSPTFMIDGTPGSNDLPFPDDTGMFVNSYIVYTLLTYSSPVGIHYVYDTRSIGSTLENQLQSFVWQRCSRLVGVGPAGPAARERAPRTPVRRDTDAGRLGALFSLSGARATPSGTRGASGAYAERGRQGSAATLVVRQ